MIKTIIIACTLFYSLFLIFDSSNENLYRDRQFENQVNFENKIGYLRVIENASHFQSHRILSYQVFNIQIESLKSRTPRYKKNLKRNNSSSQTSLSINTDETRQANEIVYSTNPTSYNSSFTKRLYASNNKVDTEISCVPTNAQTLKLLLLKGESGQNIFTEQANLLGEMDEDNFGPQKGGDPGGEPIPDPIDVGDGLYVFLGFTLMYGLFKSFLLQS